MIFRVVVHEGSGGILDGGGEVKAGGRGGGSERGREPVGLNLALEVSIWHWIRQAFQVKLVGLGPVGFNLALDKSTASG